MSENSRLLAARYRLDERIGSGGMGVVWRAYDLTLNRTVAVKQLLLGQSLTARDAEDSRARAMREARITARLQHPHAITVFDVALGPDLEGGEDSQPWLVMEYLPSRSLADVLAERGSLPAQDVASIGRQIADALAAAHQAGIVHRDVKPANVLLGDNGTAKITDFGISRASWDVTVTRTGVMYGTPAFFAPEVARGEEPGPASDVFSLGSTLYTASEGEPPFRLQDNTLALLRSVADGAVRPPQRENALSELLMQLLRYEPAQRPLMVVARDLLGRVATEADIPETAPWPAPLMSEPTQQAEPLDADTRATTRPSKRPSRAVARKAAATGAAAEPVSSSNDDNNNDKPVRKPAGALFLPPAAMTASKAKDPPPPGPESGNPAWWQRGRVLVGATLLLLVAFGAVLLATMLGGPEDAATDASTLTSDSSTGLIPTTEAVPTTEEVATTEQSTTTSAPPPPETPGPEDYEQAVRDYYGLLPDQLDEAYSYLGPGVQEQSNGRDGFEAFWSQYSEVEADNVEAQGTTVTLTIVYTGLDGSSFTEPYILEMGTAEDGRILILTSEYGVLD